MKHREGFSEATKQECVGFDELKGIVFDTAGSENGQFLAMMADDKPTSLCSEHSIRRVRIGVDEKNPAVRISDDEYTEMLLKTAKSRVSFEEISSFWNWFQWPSIPQSQVEKDLILKFANLPKEARSLDGQTIIEVTECVGQPHFLELFPSYIESSDFCILLMDLSMSLDEHPIHATMERNLLDIHTNRFFVGVYKRLPQSLRQRVQLR